MHSQQACILPVLSLVCQCVVGTGYVCGFSVVYSYTGWTALYSGGCGCVLQFEAHCRRGRVPTILAKTHGDLAGILLCAGQHLQQIAAYDGMCRPATALIAVISLCQSCHRNAVLCALPDWCTSRVAVDGSVTAGRRLALPSRCTQSHCSMQHRRSFWHMCALFSCCRCLPAEHNDRL